MPLLRPPEVACSFEEMTELAVAAAGRANDNDEGDMNCLEPVVVAYYQNQQYLTVDFDCDSESDYDL